MEKLSLEKKTILLTGGAGFIGAHLAQAILQKTHYSHIIVLDNMNAYYDPRLKSVRIQHLTAMAPDRLTFIEGDISDQDTVKRVFTQYHPQIVVNLAAQAGVRYSLVNPNAYIQSNIVGFYNILEACRMIQNDLLHLVYASSSSVYGNETRVPFHEDGVTDQPVSLYAATKKADEALAYSYSKLYDIPMTGLRFFTVYGPFGRPDMAYFNFTQRLLAGKKIDLYNYGECQRDFTYIDDTVAGIIEALTHVPAPRVEATGLQKAPHKIYNLGKGQPDKLLDFVTILHRELVQQGLLPANHALTDHINLVPMQPGDVVKTCADITAARTAWGFNPQITLQQGLKEFVAWYRDYTR